MLRKQHAEHIGLSSASTHDPSSDEICDIFFEAFWLFATSEPVDISPNHRNNRSP